MVYVSVVIPVHNGADHLRETLDSVRAQSFEDFEVICIDDGSTDLTPQILDEYCHSDRRFNFISIPNSGAGPSRNLGMERATGKYLYFLDADDLLLPHALETAVHAADDFAADVVVFKFRRFDSATGKVITTIRPDNGLPAMTIDRTSDKSQDHKIFQISTPAPWTKLFSRKFIIDLDIQFQDLPRVNDLYFGWSAMAAANRIVSLDEVMVHYRSFQSNSLSSLSRQTHSPLAIADALLATHRFLLGRGLYSEDLEKSFVNEAVFVYSVNLSSIASEAAYEQLFKVGQEQLFPELKVFNFPADYFVLTETALFVDHMRRIKQHRDFAFARAKNIDDDCVQLALEIAELQQESNSLDSLLEKLWRSPSYIFERGPIAFARKIKSSLRTRNKKTTSPESPDPMLDEFQNLLTETSSFSEFESQYDILRTMNLSKLNSYENKALNSKDEPLFEHVSNIRSSSAFDYLLFRQINGRIHRRKLRRKKDSLSNRIENQKEQLANSKTFRRWVKTGKVQNPQDS